MIAIPRVGQEVLVGFLEGNPDQPIVVGRVFNSTTTIPYKLPDHKTVTTWKSDSSPGHGGFNEIKFEDAAGTELVYMQAQRDLEKLVKRNETETTGVDRSQTIGHDLRKQVGNDEFETTGVSRIIVVGVNQNTTVGVNRSAQVGVVDSTIVGALHTLAMAPPSQTGVTMIDKKITLTTGEATITLDGPDIRLEANGNISLDAKGDVFVQAKGKVTVRSTSDDVVIHGAPNVKIN
jgi:type VI secretion system secreted protein VgrG